MKKILVVLSAVVVIGVLLLSGCAEPAPEPAPAPAPAPAPTPEPPAKEPIVLKLVAYIPDVPPGNTWTRMLIDKVNAKANGELIIEWSGGPEAIAVPDAPAAVQRGAIDMANGVYSFVPAPASVVECIAWTELNHADFRKAGAFDLAQEVFSQVNTYYLGHSYPTGPQRAGAFFSNVKIEKLSDFEGLKIALPGPEMVAPCKALKAAPAVTPFTDFYTAMERGTMDAFWLGVPGLLDWNLQEVTSYMLDERSNSGGGCFIVNLDKWNSLPKNLQDIMIEAAIETETEGEVVFREMESEILQTALDAGMEVLTLSAADSEKLYSTIKESVWKVYEDSYPEYASKFKQLIAP